MKKTLNAALIAALLVLPACSSVKRELGVGRNSPDEFTVVKRAPLTLPPDYDLRPPEEGSAAPAAAQSSNRAATILMGSAPAAASRGSGEEALLSKMGASGANPDIRSEINRENGYIALQNRSVADKLIFWKDEEASEAAGEKHAPNSVVDPKAEKERLDKNKAEGKPATEGDTPVIEKKPNTIDRIF